MIKTGLKNMADGVVTVVGGDCEVQVGSLLPRSG